MTSMCNFEFSLADDVCYRRFRTDGMRNKNLDVPPPGSSHFFNVMKGEPDQTSGGGLEFSQVDDWQGDDELFNRVLQVKERQAADYQLSESPRKHERKSHLSPGRGFWKRTYSQSTAHFGCKAKQEEKSHPGHKTSAGKTTKFDKSATTYPPAFDGFDNKVATPFINKLATTFIAFLEGVDALCTLPIFYLYKDNFDFNPGTLSAVTTAFTIPWIIKPLFAILSDVVPIMGFRRKSYIMMGSFLCCLSLLCLGRFAYKNVALVTVFLILYNLGASLCTVAGEALVVEAGRTDASANAAIKNVSYFCAFRKISFALMSYCSGHLLIYFPKQKIFTIASLIPLAVLISAVFIRETPWLSSRLNIADFKRQFIRLKSTIANPSLRDSTVFIFFLMASPSAGSAISYFMVNNLKFDSEILARIILCQTLASLLGIAAYCLLFVHTDLRRLLFISTVIFAPLCLLPVIVVQQWNIYLNIPNYFFALTDNVLMEFVGEFQILPILILAAELCPEGLESTIYSFFQSAFNVGTSVGLVISSILTWALGVSGKSFNNLSILIVICALSKFIPLVFLHLIPSKKDYNAHIQDATFSRSQANNFDELLPLAHSPSSDVDSTADSSQIEKSQSNISPSSCRLQN